MIERGGHAAASRNRAAAAAIAIGPARGD